MKVDIFFNETVPAKFINELENKKTARLVEEIQSLTRGINTEDLEAVYRAIKSRTRSFIHSCKGEFWLFEEDSLRISFFKQHDKKASFIKIVYGGRPTTPKRLSFFLGEGSMKDYGSYI